MADFESMIARFVASWNEPDPAQRRRIIDDIWSSEGVYRNATAEFRGRGEIEKAVTEAYDAFTANGYRFRVASIQVNHDAARYQWEMVPEAGGQPDSIGTHVAMVGADGVLVTDHQFIDKPPSGRSWARP